MKKVLKLLPFVFVTLSISLSACTKGTHITEPSFNTSVWKYDGSSHWHGCDEAGYEDSKIDLASHSFNDVVTPATYTSDGYTTHTCTVCGYSYVDGQTSKLEHHYSTKWSHDEQKHWHACTDAGYENLKKDEASHNFNVVVTAATYTSGGYKTHTCTVCGYSYRDSETPILDHSYSTKWSHNKQKHWHACTDAGYEDLKKDEASHNFDVVVSPATYTSEGYTTHTCTVCGYSYVDGQTSKLEHRYSTEWSHDEQTHWHACTDTGYENLKSSECSHSFSDVVTPATYTSNGYTTHTCAVCGYSYIDGQTDRLTYTITWKNWDGSILKVDQCYEGSVPSYGSIPTKEQDEEYYYVFTGWSPEVEAAYCDASYTAQYSQNTRTTFIVQYNANGGNNAPGNQIKTRDIPLTLSSTKPTFEGKTFLGWNNIYENTEYKPNSTFNLDRDVTLWAMWADTCEQCDGSGTYNWTSKCSQCNGAGIRYKCMTCGSYSVKEVILGTGSFRQCNNCGGITISNETCSWCHGNGYSNHSDQCPKCNGVGYFKDAAPTASTIEARKIVLKSVSGYEYRTSQTNWQSSPVFDNLKPLTEYVFYQRRATNGNVPFGPTSNALKVKTTSTNIFYVTYVLNGGVNDPGNPSSYNATYGDVALKPATRDYYDFVSWTYNGQAVTKISASWADDIVLEATWETHSYNISYNLDGGIETNTLPKTYTYFDESFVLPHPEKNGYTFIGWTGSNGDIPELDVTIQTGWSEDLSYKANWSLNTYKITYVLDGGTNSIKNPSTYTIIDDVTLKNATKDYYYFAGWYLDSNFSKRITNLHGYYGDLTIYAKYTPYTYNATFNSADGDMWYRLTLDWGPAYEYYLVKSGVSFSPYEFPLLNYPGHFFNGWYLDEETTIPVQDGLTINSDTTLYAKWFSNPFEDRTPSELKSNLSISCSGSQDKKGFLFYVSPEHSGTATIDYNLRGYERNDNWSVSASQFSIRDYSSNSYFSRSAPQEYNVPETGTAEYELIAGHVYYLFVGSFGTNDAYGNNNGYANITIHVNDATLPIVNYSPDLVMEQSYGCDPNTPYIERDGYDLVGWFDNNGEILHDTWDYTSDQVFHSEWKLHDYIIDYELDGGTNNPSNPSSYTINDPSIILQDPSREGYTFEGWYTDPDYEHPITSINCEDQLDYTLYAKWVADYFSVEYVLNGGINNPSNISSIGRNEDFTLQDPSREGYTFEGWYLEASFKNKVTEIHGSDRCAHKLYAKWSANTYSASLDYCGGQNCPTVTFISQSNVVKTVDLYKDSNLQYFVPESPSSDLTFGGWYTNASCTDLFDFNGTVNTDLTLYAKWVSINSEYDYANLGSSKSVSISGINNQYISIVSPVNQTVTISSSSDLDLYGGIYDSNMNLLYSCDDISDYDLDFSITFEMKAGETYYVAYRANQVSVSGDATINISGSQTPNMSITGDYTEIIENIDVVYGSSVTLPTPKKEGYVFLGWYDAYGNLVNTASWSYAENVTLYAHWAPLS